MFRNDNGCANMASKTDSKFSKLENEKQKQKKQGENEERGNWDNPKEFVLACLGNVVGLGNVWRFPYLCYRNGGGAFLLPYVIMLGLAGLPLFFLELAHGQYCSQGAMTCWRVMPFLRGMSFGQILIQIYGGITYNVVIMYCFYYMFASFTSNLPWIGCNNRWNTDLCSEKLADCLQNDTIVSFNNTCVSPGNLTDDQLDLYNITFGSFGFNSTDVYSLDNYNLDNYSDPFNDQRVTPSEEYWRNEVLQESGSLNDTNGVVWQLALCLILAWVVVYLCLVKGIHSVGKVVYFTATFPYVILVALLIRGVTLPGAVEGIQFFVLPRWDQLTKARVWLDAAVQIFYSLGVASAGQVTMSSFNKFHHNLYRDTLLIAVLNSLASILAGFAIFSIIGYMAYVTGQAVDSVVSQGFGLAFIAYPAAVATMPAGPFWAVCFFFMLIILGLDSMFVCVEVIVTGIIDMFPNKLRKHKQMLTFSVCVIGCLLGFTCVTRSGGYWMAIIDQYSANFHRLVFAFAECVGLCWLYGRKRFINDIRSMVGDIVDSKSFIYWSITWCCCTPALMLAILLFNFSNWTEPEYNGPFPPWGQAIGWMMMISSLIVIPLDWVYFLSSAKGSWRQRVKAMLTPLPSWGPALTEHREHAGKVHAEHGTNFGGEVYYFELLGEKYDQGYIKNGGTSSSNSTELHKLNKSRDDANMRDWQNNDLDKEHAVAV